MDESNDDRSRHYPRRAVLGALGLGVGASLAGCNRLSGREGPDEQPDDAAARIDELEAQLAQTEAENEALRRRLATANLWGFDEQTLEDLQSLADTWTDSVVVIDAITADGLWSVGTGWVYDDGIIASNAHVVEPDRLPDGHPITRYEVWDREGNRAEGDLLGYTYGRDEVFEDREDIGFLAVPDSMTNGRQMDRGVTRDLSQDEPLVQIGHPYNLEFWTASTGPFVAHREPFFASNVPGRPGVSGSPVLDLDGEVVGMTWGGQYVSRPHRSTGSPPQPGDGKVHPAFETAMNGLHSYMGRVETAADALL